MAAVNPRKLSHQNSLLGNPNVPDTSRPQEMAWKPKVNLTDGPGPVPQFQSRQTFEILVMEIPGIGFFYGQDSETIEQMDEYFKSLNEFGHSGRVKSLAPLTMDQIKVKGHYAVQIEEEEFWYRVEVVEKTALGEVKVFFVDCGNYEHFHPSELVQMPVELENKRIFLHAFVMKDVEPMFEEQCKDDLSRELLDWFRTRLLEKTVRVGNVGDCSESSVFLNGICINEELRSKKFELSLKYEGCRTPRGIQDVNAVSVSKLVKVKERDFPEKNVPLKTQISVTERKASIPCDKTEQKTKKLLKINASEMPATPPVSKKSCKFDTIQEDHESDSMEVESVNEPFPLFKEVVDSIIKAKRSIKAEREKDQERKNFEKILHNIGGKCQLLNDMKVLSQLKKRVHEIEQDQKTFENTFSRLEAADKYTIVLNDYKALIESMTERIQKEMPNAFDLEKQLAEVEGSLQNVAKQMGTDFKSNDVTNFEEILAQYNRWSEDHTMDLMDAQVSTTKALADLCSSVISIFEALLNDQKDEEIEGKVADLAFSRFLEATTEEKKVLKKAFNKYHGSQ